MQFQVQQTDVGDLIALYGFQLDTWIDPKTRDDAMPTFLPAEDGGEPRVLGGKGIGYQKHLAGEHEVDGWNTAEIIARGDTTTHVLNGKVVNRGKNVRLVDPENAGGPAADHPGPDRAGDRGGRDLLPERRDQAAQRSTLEWYPPSRRGRAGSAGRDSSLAGRAGPTICGVSQTQKGEFR